MLFVLSSPLFCSTNAMRFHECCEAPQATLSLLSTCSELFYSCFQPLSRTNQNYNVHDHNHNDNNNHDNDTNSDNDKI